MNLQDAVFVDLSVPLGPNPSEHVPVLVDYMTHAAGGVHLAELSGVVPEALTGGLGWASERISAITHSGTHLDAPFHYAPECAGAESRTIDDLPVEWFVGEAVCLNATGRSDEISVSELQVFEAEHGTIGTRRIVLFNTGASHAYGSLAYGDSGRPLAPDLVSALCARGVRVIGTDAWSIDPPLERMRERAAAEGGASVWQAHYRGRLHEFCALEKLTNLDCLPPTGFTVICLPVKVARGSAGWARAVAVIPREALA